MAAFSGMSGFFTSHGPIGTMPILTIGQDFWPQVEIIQNDMNRLGNVFKDFRVPLNKSLREVIIPSIQQNFLAEGRPPWEPLTAGTIENRGSSHPILRVTGLLRRRATQLNMWVIDKTELRPLAIGPLVSYGMFIQGGTRFMPARPYVLLQDEDVSKIEQIFDDWIVEQVREVGGFS